jgi:hypothetical protein
LLGRYENFPEIIHGVARFTCKSSIRTVQQTILSVLHNLNHDVCGLRVVTPHLTQECEVSFELGAAEDFDFNFLDEKELDRFQRSIVEKELSTLDFLFVARYHVVNDKGKRVPLKFDYHMLRFMFQENGMELRICHERGTQRVPLEDLVTFITKRINEELSQRQLKPLNLEYLRVLY